MQQDLVQDGDRPPHERQRQTRVLAQALEPCSVVRQPLAMGTAPKQCLLVMYFLLRATLKNHWSVVNVRLARDRDDEILFLSLRAQLRY